MLVAWLSRHPRLSGVLAVLLVVGVVLAIRGGGDAEAPRREGDQAAQAGDSAFVSRVVDGDTLVLRSGETVRLAGIDTPERGQCGYQAATQELARLVQGKQVRLVPSDEDRDRFGRLLRYVDVGGTDAGLRLLRSGHAVARYDSRDGYGFHPREPRYRDADRASPSRSC